MEVLQPLRMNNDDKDRTMRIRGTVRDPVCLIAAWCCLDLPDPVMGMLEELEVQSWQAARLNDGNASPTRNTGVAICRPCFFQKTADRAV